MTNREIRRRDLAKLFGLGAAALAGSTAQANGQASNCQSSTESTFDLVRKRGKLFAGVRFDYAPMGSVNQSGQPEGFGIDIAKEFAKRLDVQIEFKAITAATRIPLLTGGHIDVGVESPAITVQRQQVIDFTIPYFWDAESPMFRKDSPLEDIRQVVPPMKVGISRGNPDIATVKALVPNVIVVEYPDLATAGVALKQGLVDATTLNDAMGRLRVRQNPDLKLGKPFGFDVSGLTLRPNDSRWRNWLEFTLRKMWGEGVFQSIYQKWFEVEPAFTLWYGGPTQPGIEKWDGKV